MKGICKTCNTFLEGKDMDELADKFTDHNELEHRKVGILSDYQLLKDKTYLFTGLAGFIVYTSANDLRGYNNKYRKNGPLLVMETGFGLIDYMASNMGRKKDEEEENDLNQD